MVRSSTGILFNNFYWWLCINYSISNYHYPKIKRKVEGNFSKTAMSTNQFWRLVRHLSRLDGSGGTRSPPGPCLRERASATTSLRNPKKRRRKGEIYNTLEHLSGILLFDLFRGCYYTYLFYYMSLTYSNPIFCGSRVWPMRIARAATPVRLRAARVVVVQESDSLGWHPAQQAWTSHWHHPSCLVSRLMKTIL